MYKPYVITSPDWETTSGGVRVMYGLYGWLLAQGQVVFLNQRPEGSDTIAIYPEIQQGNPAQAKKVIRYILNKPGVVPALYEDGTLLTGPEDFDPTDELYYFSRLFGEAQDEDHYLFLPILNMHLFKDQKKKRTKTAYFIGKGMNYPYKPIHPADAILIDRILAQDQGALADLLNECEVLYCYDPVTAMTELARLCNTRIVMVNPLYTKEDFAKYEPGLNGISWGQDEGVVLDHEEFRDQYYVMIGRFNEKLSRFIESTQHG